MITKALLVFGLVVLSARGPETPAHYREDGPALLNDATVTPGAVDPALTARKLCSPGFRTGTVRNVPEAVKRQACAEYGVTECNGATVEIDHLISLELGGSNDIKNLWPEPYRGRAGARRKDQVEDALHRMVCRGKLTLPQAQECISSDWFACAHDLGIPGR